MRTVKIEYSVWADRVFGEFSSLTAFIKCIKRSIFILTFPCYSLTFRCVNCKLMVHKKCHKFIKLSCLGHPDSLPVSNSAGRHSNKLNGELMEYGACANAYTQEPGKKKRNFNNNYADQIVSTENSSQYSINDFNLLRVIGRGSYAKVMMVELKKTKRIYAMKVIKKSLVSDDEDIDWVQTEKHVFEIATNYPFLVGLHSCFQSPSRLFFIIEFVRGGDLMYHMQRQRRLPEEHARFYASEISLALNYLHSNSIIYRDLKLDNVLLTDSGHIKLSGKLLITFLLNDSTQY